MAIKTRKQNIPNGSLRDSRKFPCRIPPYNARCMLAVYVMVGTMIFCSFNIKAVHDPSALWQPDSLDQRNFEEEPLIASANDEPVDTIDWNDSIFSRDEWDNDPIVIESHKLLFFTIPKNSCTTFKQLFRRMMGYPNWFRGEEHNPKKNGLRYLGHYSREEQRKMMTSTDWTRAIFVRDPLERVLSAYMDKGLRHRAFLKDNCCRNYKTKIPACRKFPLVPHENVLTEDNFPFEFFVTSFMAQCQNAHWKQQSLRMRKENWKFINFVGHFENKQDDTRRLLERIGAYEEFGSMGWGDGSNQTLSIFEKNTANHKTGSGNYMKDHYSSELERIVLQYYRLDYSSELLNITKPVDYTQKLFRATKKKKKKLSPETYSDDNRQAQKFTPELVREWKENGFIT